MDDLEGSFLYSGSGIYLVREINDSNTLWKYMALIRKVLTESDNIHSNSEFLLGRCSTFKSCEEMLETLWPGI